MITGGYTPCFPSKPIVEVKFQGKKDGYATDDLIVTTGDPISKATRKMLAQVKHDIAFTKTDKLLGEVLQAAWEDFNNPSVFTRGKDAIVLITGPLSGVDQETVPWLLEHARAITNADEFFRDVKLANFSSARKIEKLEIIRYHLNIGTNGKSSSEEQFFQFLRHFHLLGYDLDIEHSVTKSLLHSHISQYQGGLSSLAWSRILEFVQQKNKHAAPITKDNIPEDLLEMFKEKAAVEFPKDLASKTSQPITNWSSHSDASFVALALLIGAWNEK
jgi:hypothetical protein